MSKARTLQEVDALYLAANIARMKASGERYDEDGEPTEDPAAEPYEMDPDDAIMTVNDLIRQARQIIRDRVKTLDGAAKLPSRPVVPYSAGKWKITRGRYSPCSIEAGKDSAALAKVYLTPPNSSKRSPEFVGNAQVLRAAGEMYETLQYTEALLKLAEDHFPKSERNSATKWLRNAQKRVSEVLDEIARHEVAPLAKDHE